MSGLFQSSSSQKAGCNRVFDGRNRRLLSPARLFQSSSSQKAGCNVAPVHVPQSPDLANCFNPHPARRPDATLIIAQERLLPVSTISFNPHPARRPDATASALPATATSESTGRFNPHPARRPDATSTWLKSVVNVWIACCGVSILIQPEGRMQPALRVVVSALSISVFQSSSSQKAGCNGEPSSSAALKAMPDVSILIQPEGRMQHVVGLDGQDVACR